MPSERGCLKEQASLTSFPRGHGDTRLTQGTLSKEAQLTGVAVPGEASTLQDTAPCITIPSTEIIQKRQKSLFNRGAQSPGAFQVTPCALAHHEHQSEETWHRWLTRAGQQDSSAVAAELSLFAARGNHPVALCLHVTPSPQGLPDPSFLPSLSELPGPPRSSTTVFLACLQSQSSTFVCSLQ